MSTGEPIVGIRVVIEAGGLPLRNLVAAIAVLVRHPRCELSGVDILMTTGAAPGRGPEDDVAEAVAHARGPVTVRAAHSPVSTLQDEPRGRVVEPRDFLPGFRLVTAFAPGDDAASACRGWSALELPLVRILVT